MANLKQTSITGSISGTTTLLVSGSSIVMPSMSGSVDSGSAAQMYIDVTPTAGLTMKLTQAGSFGTQNSPYTCLGAWSAGGALAAAGAYMGGAGTSNAGLAMGNCGGNTDGTQCYDGSTWSVGSEMGEAKSYAGDSGTQNAAISFGGLGSSATTKWDGTTWSSGTALITNRYLLAGAGTQNAALAMAGFIAPANSTTCTEEYNGSSWASGGALSLGRRGIMGGGTVSSAIAFGGRLQPSNLTEVTCNELYDGVAWSANTSMNIGRIGGGAAALNTYSALTYGGYQNPSTAVVFTEEFSGDAWAIANPLPEAINAQGGTGTTVSALSFGGLSPATSTTFQNEKIILSPFTFNSIPSTDSWSGAPRLLVNRNGMGAAGTQNAALGAGGYRAPTGTAGITCTEEFNGTVWSAGGSLAIARYALMGAGTQNAAAVFGGQTPTRLTSTEEYNGTAWSPGGNMINARGRFASAGTLTAALAIGGYGAPGGALAATEEYDGSTWTAGGGLISSVYSQGGTGTQNAALSFLGAAIPSGNTNKTEEYDGSSWATGNTANVTRNDASAGFGTQNATIATTGVVSPTGRTCTEFYNGTTWSIYPESLSPASNVASAGDSTNGIIYGGNPYAAYGGAMAQFWNSNTPVCSTTPLCLSTWSGGANMITTGVGWAGTGTINAALAAGVSSPAITAPKACTEEYNGSTWSAGGALAIARYNAGAAGTQNVGLAFGGYPSLSATEEYNGTSWSPGGALITGVYGMGAGGTQNSAIAAGGGTPASPQHTSATQLYDGSTWATGNAIINSRRNVSYGGTQNTGLLIGGYNGSYVACAESFNGTSWATATAYPNTTLVEGGVAGANSQNIIGMGGSAPINSGVYNFNGISWKSLPSLSTARYTAGSGGDSDNAFIAGGRAPTFTNSTEIWEFANYQVGAWAARAPMNVAVRDGVGGGTINAAIQATGANPGSASGQTQEYNGDSWNTQTSAPVSICESAGGGTQTAFFQASGFPSNPTTQIYNGSSWSTGGAVTVCTYGRFGSGTSNAGLLSGFQPASTCTEEYDGSSWSAGGNAIIAKRYAGMNGTQNASISFGGQSPSTMACVELYDGSSWSTGVPLIRISETPAEGGGLCRDEAIQIGGLTPSPSSTRLSNVEVYNGLAWSIGNYLPQPIKNGMNGGTSNGSLMFGGDISPGAAIASTYALDVNNPVNQGIYCFTKTL